MSVYIKGIDVPCTCIDCPFLSNPEDIEVDYKKGLYKKISFCRLHPEKIVDAWRDVNWFINNKEKWCPIKEAKEEQS